MDQNHCLKRLTDSAGWSVNGGMDGRGHKGSWRNVKGEGDNTDRELTHRRHTGMVMHGQRLSNGMHPVSCDTHVTHP